jgi:hypothetical protein
VVGDGVRGLLVVTHTETAKAEVAEDEAIEVKVVGEETRSKPRLSKLMLLRL